MVLQPNKNFHILLVEDSEGDVLLMKRAFKMLETPHQVTVAETAEKALLMLNKDKTYEDFQTPDLILLDINLPRMNGDELLQIIKKDEKLRYIPVVVLSGSESKQDIKRMYSLFASGYIAKPPDSEAFINVAKAIELFWFRVNRFIT